MTTGNNNPCQVLTFGEFIDNLPESGEYLTIVFSPSNLPLQKRWENNGLSADFIADYFKFFYTSTQNEKAIELEDEEEFEFIIENMRDTVKYIANELLENAMKFQDRRVPCTARMLLFLYSDKLIFCVKHGINTEQVQSFKDFINTYLNEDPNELYFNAMRNSAKDENAGQSGLGLLSMVCDYGAKLGWKFEASEDTPSLTTVTTMVSLSTSEQ